MSNELKESLATSVRMYRERNGLTQKELANRCGVTQTTISEIENGRANPTLGVLARISESLSIPPAALLGAGVILGLVGGMLAGPIVGRVVGNLLDRKRKQGFEHWMAQTLVDGISREPEETED